MEKVLKIVSLKDKSTDFEYWSSKTPVERLDAIELLRSQYIKFKKDVQPGLQRVCTIINRNEG